MAPLGEGRELMLFQNFGKSVSYGWLIILLHLSDDLANLIINLFSFTWVLLEAGRRELERGIWLVGYRRQEDTDN